MPDPRLTSRTSRTSLTLGTQLNYAVGNVGLQMLVAGMSFFLLIFYTDVALVPPAVAGSALLVGKIWDTVNDPLFGYLTDRTRSRHGRRRVYLIYGALPLALLAAAIWMMPVGLSPVMAFVWIAFTYTLFDTVATLVQIPYSSLAAEMTRDYDERTSLMAISSVGALLGYILGSVAMPLVVRAAPDAQTGYAIAGAALGLVAGAAIAWVAWRVREPVLEEVRAQTAPPWAALLGAMRSRPFVLLASGCGLARIGLTLVQGGLAYFVVYQLQGSKADLPRMLGALLLVVGASIVFWKWLVDHWEKNYAYAAGLGLAAAGLASLFWLQTGQQWATMAALAVIGVGMGAHWVVPFSMLPDTVDHGQAESGERRTGMYYGLFGLVDKLARTVATAAIGWLLHAFNYVPNVAQSSHSLLGIRLTVGLLPAGCLLAAIPLLLAYPISRARHAALRMPATPMAGPA